MDIYVSWQYLAVAFNWVVFTDCIIVSWRNKFRNEQKWTIWQRLLIWPQVSVRVSKQPWEMHWLLVRTDTAAPHHHMREAGMTIPVSKHTTAGNMWIEQKLVAKVASFNFSAAIRHTWEVVGYLGISSWGYTGSVKSTRLIVTSVLSVPSETRQPAELHQLSAAAHLAGELKNCRAALLKNCSVQPWLSLSLWQPSSGSYEHLDACPELELPWPVTSAKQLLAQGSWNSIKWKYHSVLLIQWVERVMSVWKYIVWV